ncbi:MAG: 16S rRNA (uracil(1498)-N(3))-methyltransferase [Hyphomicrobiaceae bacterium]|nr:16S rRNA (uracil(1498)-N(3))-methyltransferase [Hyphomicrobiaceae bacterium]
MRQDFDFRAQRLFVDAELTAGGTLSPTSAQVNYLRNVLRLAAGAEIIVFNGRDGEWSARLHEAGRRAISLEVVRQLRRQESGPDIDYLFAPLKRARLDYMVQKAAEMGVRRLRPVLTRHTIADRVNLERMQANVVEAAEQCGILHLPEIVAPVRLERALAEWRPERRLVFCDEGAEIASPVAALSTLAPGPVAVLIGPEGGFAAEERDALLAHAFVMRISLGPRILRADTAAVAALTLVNAVVGDWR